jgi:hypothetical protein
MAWQVLAESGQAAFEWQASKADAAKHWGFSGYRPNPGAGHLRQRS